MDADLLLSILGTAVAALAWLIPRHRRQRQLDADDRHPPDVVGLPVREPIGRLPSVLRGRDELTRQLWRSLRRPTGGVEVLTGPGGVGKSTVAAAFAERVRRSRVGWRPVPHPAEQFGQ